MENESRFYRVFINGEERDAIRASSWHAAKRLARSIYHVSCDII